MGARYALRIEVGHGCGDAIMFVTIKLLISSTEPEPSSESVRGSRTPVLDLSLTILGSSCVVFCHYLVLEPVNSLAWANFSTNFAVYFRMMPSYSSYAVLGQPRWRSTHLARQRFRIL